MSKNLPEKLVVSIWQHQLNNRLDMTTEDGEPVRVIYPGRINRCRGADLLDAVIATGRDVKKGDIEIHVKSSNWQAHRHHRDPAYNGVILHVVMRRDTATATWMQNGRQTPILVLERYLDDLPVRLADPARPSDTCRLPCHQVLKRLPVSTITGFLDNAGRKRFLSKAAGFRADLAGTEPGQVLYQGIMTALGYARNKLPFRELAARVPLCNLESLAGDKAGHEDGLARQQALLMGTAGLLPSQRPEHWRHDIVTADAWVEKLERLWVSTRQTGVMDKDNWQLSPVRPNNSPLRRLAAMSHLVRRHREKGILAAVIDKIAGVGLSRGHRELEELLLVTTDDYWASHITFGPRCRRMVPALLGHPRAADIALNVLLPFAFAWGRRSRPDFSRKALDLYRRYPRLAVNNLEKHMSRQLGLTGALVSSAARQQGLIHVYRTRCSQGECHACPLGNS